MRKTMRKVSVRLPPQQADRLTTRADAAELTLSDLLRRYVDAGDRADTRREQRTQPGQKTTP